LARYAKKNEEIKIAKEQLFKALEITGMIVQHTVVILFCRDMATASYRAFSS